MQVDNGKMILHLVNDEKIINRTIDLFEASFSGNNLFIVFSKRKNYKYVKSDKNVLSAEEFIKRQNEFQASSVLIHLLNTHKIHFFNKLNLKEIPVYWIIWGADLYNRLLQPKGFELFYPKSKYQRRNRFMRILCDPFLHIQSKIRAMETVRFIKDKVDYLVTDTTENDYDIFLRYYPEMQGKPWKDFFYYPIDEVLGKELISATSQGNNILIGNSASLTNNHEYAMGILSQWDIADRKVIVPLSYSGKKGYKDVVIQAGTLHWGDQFQPLLDFMPLQDYNALLVSVNVAIYGNWRQEAIGNILIVLYLGAKVFISQRNPVLEWARSHGLLVFELEQMTQTELDTSLTDKEKLQNRKILLNLYNKRRLSELISQIFVV